MGVLSLQTGIFTSNVKRVEQTSEFFLGDICDGVFKVINRGAAC
jgi:hypothetical protein